ncbi:glycosyl transferase [Histomonas meleagridis]|uniref:glycosyl transferase n=1 Tax=Histomonas meleagridis TaxID=135588 RepID=UPI003559F6A4|nr:glycosyl transferase [Histomonas meleagridis]KAH0802612.1 glycosyl transferase [Histomonas meleagridis]
MIVVYASSHGWGHNIRVLSILNELYNYPLEIVTTAPDYLIYSSLQKKRSKPLTIRHLKTDPGCVQSDPFTIDVEKTVAAWEETIANEDKLLEEEIKILQPKQVRLVISDISYFGQLVAEKLNVPSICISTFDWAFILKDYIKEHPGLAKAIDHVQEISARFDHCIIPGSVCKPLNIGKKQVNFHWTCRKPLMSKTEMRQKLGLLLHHDSVLLTFGGHSIMKLPQSVWQTFENFQFFVLVPDGEFHQPPADNVHLLSSAEWSKYHVDLVNTVDIVFGKLGYGLVSEALLCKTTVLCVERKGNPEGQILRDQLRIVVPYEEITEEQFLNGEWHALNRLVEIYRTNEEYSDIPVDGEIQAAKYIRDVLGDKEPLNINVDMKKLAILVLLVSVLFYFFFLRK